MIKIDGTDRNIFVPYTSAVSNIDLGIYNLTTTGTINGSDIQSTDDIIVGDDIHTTGNANIFFGTTLNITNNSETVYFGFSVNGVTMYFPMFAPSEDNTVDLGGRIIGEDKYWKDLWLKGNLKDGTSTLTVANCKTAYDHSQDNSQAHTDYMLNTGDTSTGDYDFTAGNLTTTGTITGGAITGSSYIDSSLKGWWRFDADAKDYSGNGYDGTLSGGAIISNGVLSCSAHAAYLNLDAHASAFASLTEGTISSWYKPLDSGEDCVLVTFADASEADSYLKIWMDLTDGKIHVDVIEAGGAVLEWASTGTAYNAINWFHVVYSSDSTGNSIEINGLADAGTYGTGNSSTQAFIADVNDVDKFYLADAGTGSKEEIDDLMIFSRRLSAAERKRLYERNTKNAYVDTLRSGITGINVSPNASYWIYVSEGASANAKEGIYASLVSGSGNATAIHGRVHAAGDGIGGLFELGENPTNAYGVKVTQFEAMYGGTIYGIYSDIVTGGGSTIWNLYMNSAANNFLGLDNAKTYFGTGKDVSIYFDNADMIINSENITANDEVHFTNFTAYTFDAVINLPYLGAAPASLANGMVWMESDGLHIYYNGAEKIVAGV